jgi:hypothetical protein
MVIMGVILYTGPESAGTQASAIFGGSDHVKILIEGHEIDVKKWIDRLTTAVKYVTSNLLIIQY